jgi:hypothetical protein
MRTRATNQRDRENRGRTPNNHQQKPQTAHKPPNGPQRNRDHDQTKRPTKPTQQETTTGTTHPRREHNRQKPKPQEKRTQQPDAKQQQNREAKNGSQRNQQPRNQTKRREHT